MSYSVVYKDIGIKDYKATWDYQAAIFTEIIAGKRTDPGGTAPSGNKHPGELIFVEHPHVYTLGKSGKENNLLADMIMLRAKGASYYHIDRGGDITYHGPGQLVGYPVFDLERIGIGLKDYIHGLEEAIIRTLGSFGIAGSRLKGGTGVWLDPETTGRARKICAIGVKVSRYVTMHGFAFNVNTDLTYFNYINPCGFTDKGVTSLEKELGGRQDMDNIKVLVRKNLQDVFDLEWIK